MSDRLEAFLDLGQLGQWPIAANSSTSAIYLLLCTKKTVIVFSVNKQIGLQSTVPTKNYVCVHVCTHACVKEINC